MLCLLFGEKPSKGNNIVINLFLGPRGCNTARHGEKGSVIKRRYDSNGGQYKKIGTSQDWGYFVAERKERSTECTHGWIEKISDLFELDHMLETLTTSACFRFQPKTWVRCEQLIGHLSEFFPFVFSSVIAVLALSCEKSS